MIRTQYNVIMHDANVRNLWNYGVPFEESFVAKRIGRERREAVEEDWEIMIKQ